MQIAGLPQQRGFALECLTSGSSIPCTKRFGERETNASAMFKAWAAKWWLPVPPASVQEGLALTLKAVTVREKGIEP
jgi:hypothetical protein